MWKYVTKTFLLFLIFCLISSCSNLSLKSLVSGDCPVENHYLCPDQRTCCDLGDSCCPDPEANTGLGCCNAGKNAVCCDGFCCWEGFVCNNGGCAIGDDIVNGTHSLWVPGVPINEGSVLPPLL